MATEALILQQFMSFFRTRTSSVDFNGVAYGATAFSGQA